MSPNSVGSWLSMAVIGLVTAAVVQLLQQHSLLCSNKHPKHKQPLYISSMLRNVPISTVLYASFPPSILTLGTGILDFPSYYASLPSPRLLSALASLPPRSTSALTSSAASDTASPSGLPVATSVLLFLTSSPRFYPAIRAIRALPTGSGLSQRAGAG